MDDWPDYYNYWDNRRDYEIGKIKFIDGTRKYLHREFVVDRIIKSDHIKTILEVGPGEMVEYQAIAKNRPDIKYSIADVALLFINNCRKKYPDVDTYRIPLERLDSFERYHFDCVYQASVFEHSADVRKAIKNCIHISKEFYFSFFKWRWTGGGLESKYYPRKNLYSTSFNMRNIIKEIELYGTIDYAYICLKNGKKLIPFKEFAKGKKGEYRSGNYLVIHGKQKTEERNENN